VTRIGSQAAGVGLVVLALVLLLTGREPPRSDAGVVYDVAVQLATHGSIALDREWPPMSHRGPDERIYSLFAIAPSLAQVPGVWLREGLDRLAPHAAALSLVLTSHVVPAASIAIACAMLFAAVRRRGASMSAAVLATALALGATQLFEYARFPANEAMQAMAFLGFVLALLRIADGDRTLRAGIWLGTWAGFAVNTKAVLLLGVIGGLIALAVLSWRDRHKAVPLAFGICLGTSPWAALFLAYNAARWGSPFDTGYGESLMMMRETLWAGLMGLLLSPGKGLLWFSPGVLLSFIAMRRAWRGDRALVVLVVASVVPVVLFYARYLSWSGDYSWGPRYLTFAIPVLFLPVAHWLDSIRHKRSARALVAVVLCAGIVAQALGSAVYWDQWIRLSRQARIEWLGNPNRDGAAIDDHGRGNCDSCIEDMFGHQWLPAFSPLAGHWWLARHLAAGDDWPAAAGDAPWSRYTTLRLDTARDFYRKARFDWWALDAGESGKLSGLYCALIAVLASAGAWLWRRGRDRP
jgi:hypothetical protein